MEAAGSIGEPPLVSPKWFTVDRQSNGGDRQATVRADNLGNSYGRLARRLGDLSFDADRFCGFHILFLVWLLVSNK